MSRVLTLGLVAAVIDGLLQLFLYLRPSPTGTPFVLDPAHYVFHAVYYGTWAHALLALPFALWAYARRQRKLGPSGLALGLQLVLAALLLVIGTVDHEVQRFLGSHITLEWLHTYAAVDRTPGVIWDTLRSDLGGAWSSFVGLGVALSYAPVAVTLQGRLRYPLHFKQRKVVIGVTLALVVWPTVLWNVVPGGRFREAKVRPALLQILREARRSRVAPLGAHEVAEATRVYQQHWQAVEGSSQWSFDDPAYPLRKHHQGRQPAVPAQRPNIIVLALETFRAKDMQSMNPGYTGPQTTPFLDSLARRPDSAYYQRYYASGVPTVFAFMSIHASLVQHPHKSIPTDATAQNIDGFPKALGSHGYRTLHFTGSDPDWDSQRVWLNRWYDEVHYSADDRERDRLTFRHAAQRLREVGREARPFFAYLVSISNHMPFRSPEPELDVSEGDTSIDRLHNTMRYTDDVVRELYEGLQNEPWFANTIWVITGDHGFDLGDRGESGGHENLRHETTWVPLIVHGKDPRLPRGKQLTVGSHVDLAPTLTELAGIWDDNSYMGHSLLHQDASRARAVVLRGEHYAVESRDWSMYKPADGPALVYAGDDLAQQTELSHVPPEMLAEAQQIADAHTALITHTVDADRVAPRAQRLAALSGP